MNTVSSQGNHNGKDLPHERSQHCLANMMATYNTLEEKLVDFIYRLVHDVIRLM